MSALLLWSLKGAAVAALVPLDGVATALPLSTYETLQRRIQMIARYRSPSSSLGKAAQGQPRQKPVTAFHGEDAGRGRGSAGRAGSAGTPG